MRRVRAPAGRRRGPRAKPGERSTRVVPSGASACEPMPAVHRWSQQGRDSSPAGNDRHRPVSIQAKSRDGEAPVATKAIVGEKVGMTQIWDDQNRAIPVTVVRVAPVRVVQVKTPEHEGYSALQVTWGHRRASALTRPEKGHYDKSGVDPGRRLVELRIDDTSSYEVGQQVTTLNLEIVQADPERELILVKGAVPGPRGGIVVLRNAVKAPLVRGGKAS